MRRCERQVEQELTLALDVRKQKPADEIYLIPVRLEECDVPESLRTILWIDLFREGGERVRPNTQLPHSTI